MAVNVWMKRGYILAGVSAMLISAACAAAERPPVFMPDTGVVCDEQEQFCADGQGVSVGLTDAWLGSDAAQALQDEITTSGKTGSERFGLSNGVVCDGSKRECETSDKHLRSRAAALTRQLWPVTAQNIPQGKSKTAIFFPDSGVICDRVSHFCADQQGISMGLTTLLLGKSDLEKLQKALGDMTNVRTDVYTLSNGVYCESQTRVCYVDRFKSGVETRYTRWLFQSKSEDKS